MIRRCRHRLFSNRFFFFVDQIFLGRFRASVGRDKGHLSVRCFQVVPHVCPWYVKYKMPTTLQRKYKDPLRHQYGGQPVLVFAPTALTENITPVWTLRPISNGFHISGQSGIDRAVSAWECPK